jgi:hypothetical protein
MVNKKSHTFGMKTCVLLITSTAFFQSISLATPITEESGWPRDVKNYIESRELCDHFRSEAGDTSDDIRKSEIEEGLTNCEGTDARLASLKYLYAKSPEVMEKLRRYDTLIEGNERGLPRDVWSYLTARVQCDGLRVSRTRESSSIDSTSSTSLRDRVCSRANDRLLARLKSRHARNLVVMEALSEFAPLSPQFQIQRRH